MTPRTPARWGALVALAAAALLPPTAARWARARFERVLAARDATAAARYLAVVTPMPRAGGGYDLLQLLIRARALAALPGLAVGFEVYNRTAPLVHATAPPLPPAALERLRREGTVRWTGKGMLVPLLDRDGWDVVGAVAADPPGEGWLLSPWSLAALLLLCVAGTQAVRALGAPRDPWRQALARYSAAAGLFGVAVFADVRLAGRGATDRWLSDVRVLMQEAAARVPETRSAPGALAPIARGAEVVPADSLGSGVARRDVGGLVRAVVAVRLGPGRWVELRASPMEAGMAPWLAVLLGLAALGPLAALLAGWSLAASPERRRETVAAWGFLAPSALHLAAFTVGPVLFALYLSVHRFSPVEPARPLIGLAGYVQALANPLVWAALGRTLLYACHVPVSMGVALALALLLHGRSRGARLARALFFLPAVTSVVASALVWRWMYHPDVGLINHVLTRAGLGPVDWLGDPGVALIAVMIVSVWTQLGYQMAVFHAGLGSIPPAYVDAARVDGANAWQRFRRVTLPLLRPVILFALVTGVIGACQVFALVAVLTGGGPLGSTDVLVYRIYRTAWEQLEFGDASVLSLLLFVLLIAATRAQLKLLDRRVEYA
ncbi:MAG TPA: sugar ABC transporter permease [Gemmatimonadales bacterium]|nr:sugar ABC transporter permease [Gemmatimonadales bacterium]